MNKTSVYEFFAEYKVVLFDLDGVLINSDQAWIIALRKVLEEEGLFVPPVQKIKEHLALSTIGQIKLFFPEMDKDPSLFLNLASKVDQYYLDHITENVILVDQSIELLESIREFGIRLGVVTNNGGEVTSSILETFKLVSYFESVVHLDNTKKPKPDPSPLFKSIEYFQIEKRSVLFVGDSPSDLEASIKANVDFILIKNQNSSFIFPEIPENVKIVAGLVELIP
jgi:phosphoglycolate phosphatase-like HAD superfamily hydrolase